MRLTIAGIGTASPSVDLEIASTAGTIKLSDTDGSDKETIIKHSGGTFFLQARDGSSNAPLFLVATVVVHLMSICVFYPAVFTFNGDTAAANALMIMTKVLDASGQHCLLLIQLQAYIQKSVTSFLFNV